MSVNLYNKILHADSKVRITTDRMTIDRSIQREEDGLTVGDLLKAYQEDLGIPQGTEFRLEIRSQEREYIVTNTD